MKFLNHRRALRAVLLAALPALLSGVPAHAASRDVLHDVRSYFEYMENAKNRGSYHRDVVANLETAKQNRAAAAENVKAAEKNKVDAGKAVADSAKAVADTKAYRGDVEKAIENARATVEEKEAAAAAAEQQADGVATRIAARQAELGTAVPQGSAADTPATSREAYVRSLVEGAGYAQNRVFELERESYAPAAATASGGAPVDTELAGLQSEEASLRQEAAQARAEAQSWRITENAYIAEKAQVDDRIAAAEQWNWEAADWEKQAVQAVMDAYTADENAEKLVESSQDALDHFGAGRGFRTGFEYYSWKGDHRGHQFYMPYEFYQEGRNRDGKNWTFGLSTGYVQSDTGASHGSISTWTDTSLLYTYANDKPVNRTRYTLALSLPTGKSDIWQNSVVANDLARFTDFGAGFNVTPGIEWTHRYSNVDSLTLRTRYTFRGGYDYEKDHAGSHIDPGDIWDQEAEYLHAGEDRQYMVQLFHQSTGWSDGHQGVRGASGYEKVRYEDGDEYELRLFLNQPLDERNDFAAYTMLTYMDAMKGYSGTEDVKRTYFGLGWTHRFSDTRRMRWMVHYKRIIGEVYDPQYRELGTNSSGRKRYSLTGGYDWKLSPAEQLTFRVERYVIEDDADHNYNGWGTVLYYTKQL